LGREHARRSAEAPKAELLSAELVGSQP
jgi:hypothetical protein